MNKAQATYELAKYKNFDEKYLGLKKKCYDLIEQHANMGLMGCMFYILYSFDSQVHEERNRLLESLKQDGFVLKMDMELNAIEISWDFSEKE